MVAFPAFHITAPFPGAPENRHGPDGQLNHAALPLKAPVTSALAFKQTRQEDVFRMNQNIAP